MHELSVCRQLVQQLTQLAQKHQATKITLVELSVGALSGIEPDLLKMAFPMAVKDSVAEDATLSIVCQPVTVKCRDCHKESEVATNQLTCPHCASHQTQLTGGDAMLLTRFSMRQEEENHCV